MLTCPSVATLKEKVTSITHKKSERTVDVSTPRGSQRQANTTGQNKGCEAARARCVETVRAVVSYDVISTRLWMWRLPWLDKTTLDTTLLLTRQLEQVLQRSLTTSVLLNLRSMRKNIFMYTLYNAWSRYDVDLRQIHKIAFHYFNIVETS